MQRWKLVLLTSVAAVTITACSADRGPGEIGSRSDITVRNAGEDRAPPPPELAREDITQVEMASEKLSETVEEEVEEVVETVEAVSTTDTMIAEDVVATPQAEPEVEMPADPMPVTAQPMETTPMTPPAQVVAEVPPMQTDVTEVVEAPGTSDMPESSEAAVETPRPPMVETPTERVAPEPAPQMAQTDPQPVPQPVMAEPSNLSEEIALLKTASPQTVMETQSLLTDAGFYTGPVDGRVTSNMLNSYIRYRTAPAGFVPGAQAAPASSPAAPAPAMTAPQTGQAMATIPASDNLPQRQVSIPTLQAPAGTTPMQAPQAQPAPIPANPPPPGQIVQPLPDVFPATVSMTDPKLLMVLQKKLSALGLYQGAMTGRLDTMTLNALSRYQSANGLAPGRLTMETLRSLDMIEG